MNSTVIDIGDRTCLFLDDHFIAQQSGLRRVWHAGRPGDVCIEPAGPWEGAGGNGGVYLVGSVLRDPRSGLLQMYYQGWQADSNRYSICYAESRDGRTWNRPILGLHRNDGGHKTNIILRDAALPNVLLNPDPSESRFMMCASAALTDGGDRRHVRFGSADGVHWDSLGDVAPPPPNHLVPEPATDGIVTTWDARSRQYRIAYKVLTNGYAVGSQGCHRRAIGMTSGPSLVGGMLPVKPALWADDRDDQSAAVRGRDSSKRSWAELYLLPLFPYGNHFVGWLSVLQYIDGSDRTAGGGELQPAFSHDGVTWHRPPLRQSAIESDARDDLHAVFAMDSAPIQMGDEMCVYYTEANCAHPILPLSKFITRIRMATWRTDGFVSMRADSAGVLLTQQIESTGGRLIVNYKPSAAGSLRVALLDRNDEEIPGFSLADCNPILNDHIFASISWKTRREIPSEMVRLQFDLNGGELFSFRIARDYDTDLR